MTALDLAALSVGDLLRLDDAILAELRRRELVRTNNKPIGDIAERVVLVARGGVIEPNSTKSHDITTPQGQRIQVKAMGTRSVGAAAKFSGFRTVGFDTAVFLVFDAAWDLAEAWELEPAALAEVRRSPHTNSSQPTLRQVRTAGGNDVTAEMRAAWRSLDAKAAER